MRESRSCTVTIPEGENPTITATNECLVAASRPLEKVSVDNKDATGTLKVTFSFKSNTSGFTDGTMVFSSADALSPQCCLVVSSIEI